MKLKRCVTLSGIETPLLCNRKSRNHQRTQHLKLEWKCHLQKAFLVVKLNAVLDNLKCLNEVSGQKRDEAVGAGPPINFLFAGFKIRAPSGRLKGDMGANQYFLNKSVYTYILFFNAEKNGTNLLL